MTQLLSLLKDLKQKHLKIHRDINAAAGDKGYDSEENCRRLYDEHGIKPVYVPSCFLRFPFSQKRRTSQMAQLKTLLIFLGRGYTLAESQ
jgi:hypothetical protein